MPTYERDIRAQEDPKRTPQPNQGRVIEQQNAASVPISCTRCGSTFFYTAHVEQVAGGGWGSMEFRSLTQAPVAVRICVCGLPLVPTMQSFGGARQAVGSREEFHRSVREARAMLEQLDAAQLLNQVAQAAPSRSEMTGVVQQLETIASRVADLEQPSGDATVSAAPAEEETAPEAPKAEPHTGKRGKKA